MENIINQVLHGDAFDLLKQIPEESVQLVLTDPPYNISGTKFDLLNNKTGGPWKRVNETWDEFKTSDEYLEFSTKWINLCDKLLKPNGSTMICCTHHNIAEVIFPLKKLGYKFQNIITWRKINPMPNVTKRMFTHSTEYVVWFTKGKNWIYNYEEMKKYNSGKQLRDVWEFPVLQGKERIKDESGKPAHPTQKPMKLFTRLIEAATNEEDLILDPFIGTGTTAEVALLNNRKWIGIEQEEKYVKIANERIKQINRHK